MSVTEISGKLQALCAEIDAHVSAAETVRMLAGSYQNRAARAGIQHALARSLALAINGKQTAKG